MRVSRRKVLAGAAGVTTVGILHWPANAAEFTYKLGHDEAISHPQNVWSLEAAKKIRDESGGRLIVQVYPNNQLGGDTQMLAQLRSGALELMQLSDNILANIVPAANLTNIPFSFNSEQDVWTAMDGELGRYVHAQIEKIGLHPFEKGWDAGLRHVFTSGKPVHNVEDIKGLKLRVPAAPLQVTFFKAIGSSPTPINNNELYSALQTHLVDGAEQPLFSIEAAKYYEVSKYVSLTKHQATTFEMLANGVAWQRLPKDLQEILSRNFNDAAIREREDIAKGETTLGTQLTSQGLTIIQPDRESFRAVVQQAGLYAQWRDTFGKEPFGMLEKVVGKLA
ncbi:MAG: TRAP transporter substrate-binding protein [Rhizobiales bacterium]|nr:TRAP transporter substrate-binding protein [Hyphomicrobiales bacterium]